ncbi:hypothetical protein PSI22_18975 [Xenorhabdus sp. XENO-7]|uniref:Uncharacterized protein n=1 Tax=Xenorhabdus aichiensis TaxID=3025874 RepID=A0ABT5M894_9GAMM|nr:hypothetical protein [Xenorhabdus aichiensis]MDC9623661.1 hypothetical protein [Xenorhabdus aichiensis]
MTSFNYGDLSERQRGKSVREGSSQWEYTGVPLCPAGLSAAHG